MIRKIAKHTSSNGIVFSVILPLFSLPNSAYLLAKNLGYQFFISEGMDDRIFWGVLLLAFWTGTIGIKIWFWLEMNRNSTLREIKRLELAVAQLTVKLNQG